MKKLWIALILALTLCLLCGAALADTVYTVTLTANPSEGGTVTGAGAYSDGETVTIAASANGGYRFDHWERGDGSFFVETASYAFVIHDNISLVAVFVEDASNVSSYTLAMPQSVTISPNAVTTAFAVNVSALDLRPNASGNTPESFRVKINATTLVSQSDPDKMISFKLTPYGTTVGLQEAIYLRFDSAQSKPGYIVITDSQWAAAAPGVYTGSMTYQPYYQYSNGNVEWLETTKSIPVTLTIPEPAITYTVTVNNGTGGGSYAQGASVKITANAAPEGQQFNKWTGADGLTFIDGSATTATATFTMPAEAVTLTATYSETGIIPGEYALTLDPNYENKPVDYITGISSYTLPSLQRTYYDFLGWAESSDGAVRYHAGETVTLEGNLTLFAKWEGNNIPPSYSLSPTEYTLSGSGYTDIPCTLTSIEAGWISEISGGRLVEAIAEVIGFYMNGGTMTDGSGHSIPFLVDNPWHTTGPQQRALQQREFNMDQQGVTVGMAIYIDPDVFSQAAPGTYTGTFTYDSYWRSYSANTGEVAGESGSIALTLVVPEQTYAIADDGAAQAYTYDDSFNQVFPTGAAAGTELSLWIREDAMPDAGKYFTGEFTLDGVSLGSVTENGWTHPVEGFIMPAHAVTIGAVQAQRETLTLNFTQSATLSLPLDAWMQLQMFESENPLILYDDASGIETLDVNLDGTGDLLITHPDGTGTDITLTLLPDQTTFGSFDFAFTGATDRYGTISFILSAPAFGTADFTLPAAIHAIEDNAFEGIAATVVGIPSGCASIGDYAFANCPNLTQIRIPASVTAIGADIFSGCAHTVYVFGTAGSAAETYCQDPAHNCVFVAE